jgi:UDP-glucuronate decarboxylase
VTGQNLLGFSSSTNRPLLESDLDVVVTGGGGWLGRATLEMLESSLGSQVATRVHVFASSRRSMTLRTGTTLEVLPLSELPGYSVGPHLVAHYAFVTRELVTGMRAADYIARNEEITDLVVDHATRSQPAGIVALSSGAVYLGDDMAINPYGVLKARAEQRFFGISETGPGLGSCRVVVPRLFNLAGPFLNKPDHYVLGSIIRDIVGGGPIQLRAARPVIRSYVHVADLVDLLFSTLLGVGPLPSQAFDTAGEVEIEVGELAELAKSVLGKPELEIVRPSLDGSPADRYVGDPSVFWSLARAHGTVLRPLSQQIEDTARFLGAP